jgi:hypothetical protein
VTTHQLVEIACAPGGCVATCTCGWRSGTYPSAGLAGSVWDVHVTDAQE